MECRGEVRSVVELSLVEKPDLNFLLNSTIDPIAITIKPRLSYECNTLDLFNNMATSGAIAGLQTFEALNIDYEKAYGDNPLKIACVELAIGLLPSRSRVLDIGCGTGVPVSQKMSKAGLTVVGFDISPKMIEHAKSRIDGHFSVCDMLTYQPRGPFSGIFFIFSHLQLSYADFHAAIWKFVQSLEPEGIVVVGQMPGDTYVTDESHWDASRTWVEHYEAPFMGKMLPTLMLSAKGQRDFLTSMGLDIVNETVEWFRPKGERCEPEKQQYIIARRKRGEALRLPRPLPDGET